MALFVPGKTPCVVCGFPILDGTDAVMFPAFIPAGHRLHEFSDAVFHAKCLENWRDRTEYLRLYERYKSIMASRPRNVPMKEADEWGRRAFERMNDPDDAD